MNDTTEGSTVSRVVCPAVLDLAIRPLVLAVALVAFGIWCAMDQQPHKPLSEDMNAWLTWAMNFYGQFGFPALGLIPLYFGIRALRRKMIADEQGVGFEGKEKIAWSSVTGLDAGELQSKQILVLLHGDGQRYTIDGFDLRKDSFRQLVDFVEAHVPQTEPEPAPQPEAEAPPAEADQTPPGAES